MRFSRSSLMLAALFILLGLRPQTVTATESTAPQPLPAGIHLPVKVHLSARVLNISRIEETKGEVSARLEYTLSWRDDSHGFDPLAAGVYRQDFYGGEATGALKAMWHPDVSITNQLSDPRSQSVAVSVTSEGDITVVRQIDADFRILVNLAAFPFDRQKLDFAFVAARYPTSEVIFTIDDRDRELSSISESLSVADWHPGNLGFTLEQFYGWNAKPFVRATVTATVERAWPRYLLRLFIPFAAVVSVSLFILWAPEKLRLDHAGIIYSALLALAALSFTFESSFPGSMSVNSPIAFMISIGYFYLVLTLLVHLSLIYANIPVFSRYPFLRAEIRNNVRFVLPAIFTLVCVCSVVRSLT
ncbi:neurotransmitter-gated ion-channel ligand-binding protein [Rhizobium sp. KVB221]|uniref:Neurotransmitter-gated ion-channel ligand-binding protein n=1 Tax=Rhizobium setariae TaxID=2801340 RepID=A0A937CJ68_9HYPH|nr:neurotransmitter-gated ion-channel ligand-binding protein [Rhizobium setariae]MBL0370790.1 neurotransmitter-gated ion-channel ligand-binding protein [Rhizobium setariae]